MTFEEYLKIVVPKIGPNGAFDLSRDALLTAFKNILIEKKIATNEEIESEIEKQLGESASNIVNMPPFPNNQKKENDSSTKKST